MSQSLDISIENILARLPSGPLTIESYDLIRRAYDFACTAHNGQTRKSGEPYIQHPLNVAYLLAEMRFDPAVIAAGLLHDVLEDCHIPREELEAQFGKEVLVLVEGVTKLDRVEDLVKEDSQRTRDLQELESLRKLLLAMVQDDVRVIFIKLADRLHNMRTLDPLPPENQQRMARETLEIFAPVANRLGIWVWKAELEDLAFRYLNPPMFEELTRFLNTHREEREARVAEHIQVLRAALEREEIPAQIKGRSKHIYSIYHKMRRKNLPFARIYDAEGLRVLVDTENQCYQVLGIVHHLWTPIPGEFDDYIANPKPNGYQSLHTAVIGQNGTPLEVQIRTYDMDEIAEFGVAAHWRYKEQSVRLSDQAMQQITTVRQSFREYTQETSDARDLVTSVRSDVFRDRVYVFTPRGKVIDLPVGATPLDFAYAVHTEIGHTCRGAKVDGRWVPLHYQLKTGEQVEIIRGRKGGPSRDWLNEELGYVKTPHARQKIKQWFRRQDKEQNIAQGRLVIDKLLKRLGLPLFVEEVADLFRKRYATLEDFLVAVGVGDITSDAIARRLESYVEQFAEKEEEKEGIAEEDLYTGPTAPPTEVVTDGINVRGTGGLLMHLGRCCNPLPGEEIVGYITRGHGVTIHRQDCPNILRMGPEDLERLIEVEWGKEKRTFPIQIVITAYDRAGLLHDITEVIANNDINMASVSTGKRSRYNILPVYMTLEVPDLATLTRVLAKIGQIRNVIEAKRLVA
ncbi:MAG TPA: bifunctional (p)ppGpp synthetase/guanosine-3',5'-bis(diphosphate) 3'-pyrophosphohydrolase [Anaerolineae bacterium]|nr:bifunctional (p)ppGpp synthetase/guanosine-3',5'-bis(diphosphate) 3'-pyrophosphohydrolase [Anaerolineae bacterium]HQK14370.1 bifunctional (p)ppGpp synthetase/guanosine-3',5'-bis(diphosphate) 3'-pyrophosphohydrolase [Anaerolineae bacterium]